MWCGVFTCGPPPPPDFIRDNDPLTNRYISVPRDLSPLNCAAFMGGIVRGALDAAGFVSAPPSPFPSYYQILFV